MEEYHVLDTLEDHSVLVAVIIALAVFPLERLSEYYKNKNEKADHISRARAAVIREIQDHIAELKNPAYKIIDDIPKYKFKSLFFNVDSYDSLIHSGLFTHFRPETQYKLSNLYIRIKLNNRHLQERTFLKGQFLIYRG